MLVALDSPSPQAKRIYADDDIGERKKYTECYCQACLEKLIHKKGEVNRPYFSHKSKTNCKYGQDPDYNNKSGWHIRMQDYFPREMQEKRFVDEKTNEVHIADIYIPESKTVIEFQKSHIEGDEFWKRTIFHTNHKRRIVWVFDESRVDENEQYIPLGRFRKTGSPERWPYNELTYQWLRCPRQFLAKFPATQTPIDPIKSGQVLSLCAFVGNEGDVVHRICNQHDGYKRVVFSIHTIRMTKDMNINEFFISEQELQEIDPYKKEFSHYYSFQKRPMYRQMSSFGNMNKRKRHWHF